MPRPNTRYRVAGAVLLGSLLLAGCDRAEGLTDGDVTRTDVAGDVATDSSEFPALGYEITSERYRQWLLAQRALDQIPGLELEGVRLRGFREDDMDRVEDQLEDDPRAKVAIQGAGMTVRDYVRTSVALEQSMAAAAGALPIRASELPRENVALLSGADDDAEFERTWNARRVRVVEADSRDRVAGDDGDSDRGKKKAKKQKKQKRGKRGRGGDSDGR